MDHFCDDSLHGNKHEQQENYTTELGTNNI